VLESAALESLQPDLLLVGRFAASLVVIPDHESSGEQGVLARGSSHFTPLRPASLSHLCHRQGCLGRESAGSRCAMSSAGRGTKYGWCRRARRDRGPAGMWPSLSADPRAPGLLRLRRDVRIDPSRGGAVACSRREGWGVLE
jgi:hypothetical protein